MKIALPPKLIPVFQGSARVRGAHGGRGSGKTRSFALMSAIQGMRFGQAGRVGQILCGREYMNSLADSSFQEVKLAILSSPELSTYYECGETFIRSKDGRITFTFAGLRHNLDSIKSKARILLAWIDEAENVTEEGWIKLIPTVREEGSEIWVTWNPENKGSPTDQRFRNVTDEDVKIVELNWRDNPKFPSVLEKERQRDKRDRPDDYDHIWEGAYRTTVKGAYYAKRLTEAREAGRIGRVAPDPLMTIRLFCDIGGTGAKSDAFAMWAAQFIGHEIRVVNYYESQGQPIDVHLAWLRKQGYEPDTASIWLPHDGKTNDRVYDVSYESAFHAAGYDVTVIPNQGKGAASARIEEARRLFPSIWFDAANCEAGLDALGWYHEKWDDRRNIGLGPEHDWASHGADAFGLMCVAHEPPTRKRELPVMDASWVV